MITGMISLHNVKSMRLSSFSPDNANCIGIEFVSRDGDNNSATTLSVFGLSREDAMQIARSLCDAASTVYADTGNGSLLDYLTEHDVFEKIDGPAA